MSVRVCVCVYLRRRTCVVVFFCLRKTIRIVFILRRGGHRGVTGKTKQTKTRRISYVSRGRVVHGPNTRKDGRSGKTLTDAGARARDGAAMTTETGGGGRATIIPERTVCADWCRRRRTRADERSDGGGGGGVPPQVGGARVGVPAANGRTRPRYAPYLSTTPSPLRRPNVNRN